MSPSEKAQTTTLRLNERHRQIQPALGCGDIDSVTRPEQPMFPRNLERVWYDLQKQARDGWKEAAEKSGDIRTLERLDAGKLMPRIRLHDLRHEHISLLVKKGVDAATIADRVGHTNPSFTLNVYAHLFDEQRTAAAISILDLLPKGDLATAN